MIGEIAVRHLFGGRFRDFVRWRRARWATFGLSVLLSAAVGIRLGAAGHPVYGILSGLGIFLVLLVLRARVHKPLPDSARGAYATIVSTVAVAGIAIGVMTLIVVVSVMDGFSADIRRALLKTTPEVVVTDFSSRLDPAFLERVRRVPGVKSAWPYIEENALAKIDGVEHPFPLKVRGIDPGKFRSGPAPELLQGNWGDLNSPDQALIGSEFAKTFLLRKGDAFWILTARGAVTSAGVVPRMRHLTVAGIFRTGFYEVDRSMIFTGVKTASTLFAMGRFISGIEVSGGDPMDAKRLADKIATSIPAPLLVLSWQEMRRNLYKAMRTERTAMFIIEAFLVLVASFNISSALFMAVGRKTREIGLLLAMGMSRMRILLLFGLEGLLLGGTGTFLGLFFGVAFCKYLEYFPVPMPGGGSVYYIDSVPVQMSPALVVATTTAALLMSLGASLYPARSASKLSPSRALRFEV
ncbi:MAG: ABC transporter permease [Candidatus Hydrogenedentota bacterium]|nr:MAG: ABC transporter permease [Candidatus Hydrogenedentota bacterium]